MATRADLPAVAQTLVETYLDAAAAVVPSLVEGLYLTGSAALADFHPQHSDIDFVAVTAERPSPAERKALARVHAQLRPRRPCFDGIYVTWQDLAADPRTIPPGPGAHEGRLYPYGRGERHPITWHLLGQQGIACHGPAVADLTLWRDPAALAAWTDRNLDQYWQRFLDRGRRLYTPRGLAGLTAWACAWCVLGVSRLHYTLATGAIASKTGAGLYARGAFPAAWQRVIDEALRIRRGVDRRSLYRSPLARRRDVLALMEMVIAEGSPGSIRNRPRLTPRRKYRSCPHPFLHGPPGP